MTAASYSLDAPVSYTHLDVYKRQGNAFPGMIRWFFDIPSKLIHWRLNLVRTLGAYVPWLRRDDGSMKIHAGTLVDLFATILSGRRHLSARDAVSYTHLYLVPSARRGGTRGLPPFPPV